MNMKMTLIMTALAMATSGMTALAQESGTIGTNRSDASVIRVRYIVENVDEAVAFYTNHLNFHVSAKAGRNFAMLARNNLQLVLSPIQGPGGASQSMPDGRRPEPGGWNRIILPSDNLEKDVAMLKKAGVHFRNDIVSGPGGRETLLDDPSGNPVELFEPTK